MGILKTLSQGIAKNISKNIEKTGSVGGGLLKSSQQVKTASILTTGVVAGSVLAPAATARIGGQVIKAIVPKTIGGLVGTTALVGLATTKGGRELIGFGAKGIFEGAKATGQTYSDIKSGDKEFTGADLLKAGIGGAALLGGALFIPDLLDKQKETMSQISAELPKDDIQGVQKNAAVQAPVLPETQTISTTATKKRKKTRSKPRTEQISQRVNIDIINNNSAHRTTKKYINAIALR